VPIFSLFLQINKPNKQTLCHVITPLTTYVLWRGADNSVYFVEHTSKPFRESCHHASLDAVKWLSHRVCPSK